MWTCPKCNRNFKSKNQSHMCSNKTIDEVFAGKPERLMFAFDEILVNVIDWEPCSVGVATHSIVFTKEKAWLIVKPMTKELDIKFYTTSKLEHTLLKKTLQYRNTWINHIRINDPGEVNDEFLKLVRQGYDAF